MTSYRQLAHSSLLILASFFAKASCVLAQEADEAFSEVEVRVIRPRYFSKQGRFELGLQGSVLSNQTFIYTYLMAGMLSYHLSEQWGLELSAALGFSKDKDEKTVLDRDFSIKTQIVRTRTMYEANVLWTPIYGKYQLANGRLIYFDSFLSAGGGFNGIDYRFDHCRSSDTDATDAIPANKLVQYPTASVGIGQRFFLSTDSSLKWDLRNHLLFIKAQDGACTPQGTAAATSLHQNISMQFGYTLFF